MSRRGGGRGSDSRRDHPSPAASRGGGGRGGAGRGRGAPPPRDAPVPSPAPAPVPSPATAPTPRPAPPQMPAPATAPSPRPAPPRSSVAAPAPRPGPVPSPTPGPVPSAAASSSSAAAAAESLSADMEQMTVAASPPPASSKAVRYPARPGFGKFGRKCMVRANHFLVEFADIGLCQYDVSITPEITSKKVNRDVIEQLVELYSNSHLGSKCPAYDGRKSLYTAGELPFKSKEFVIKLVDDDGQAGSSTSRRERREREFKVAIKFASKPDLDNLRQFIRGRQPVTPQETIQALDVVLRHAPSQKYNVVGRSFFHPSLGDMGELGNGLEFWKGYYQSLRPIQMGLSLNIDVSARAFYEPIPVTQFVAKYLNLRDPSRPLSEHDRIKVKKALRGVKVESNHLAHTKTYKVSGVSMEPINKLMFKLDDGRQISVHQYFREKYRIALKYATWPALQAGSAAKPAYLPMEICKIVGGQRYSRKLNEVQVRNLLRATCERPPVREGRIKNMVAANRYNDEDVVKKFGMQVKAEMAMVEARVLPPPMLLFHGTGKNATETPRMGQWNMIDKKMVNGGKVDFWTCVNFSQWNPDLQHRFCADLVGMCSSKGIVFQPVPVIPIYSAHPSQIERTLLEVHEKSMKVLGGGKQLQLLIVILPDASGSYGKIKRVCETELGIVSQCCQPRQAGKLSKQYLENLALKINVKVGGRNSVLNDVRRALPLVTDAPTIIFGADVTHPQPGEDSSPSIAAVVASMDWPEITKYRGLVSAQTHREEIIQDLYTSVNDPRKGLVHGGMIRDLLLAFFRSTGQKPKRIIFYRDGVSEGQFSQVLLHEMDAIRKGCMSLEAGYLPPVTFVVVQKRHHTRLFPTDNRETDRSGNILPGTVVDTQICHPTEFDFYLNSHAGIQGTSRPTHYHVLYDENRFSADGLQILTNNLCYTYARCTRSVSIVPPAYYAHLAAFRARYYIEGDSDAGSSSGGAGGGDGGPRTFRPLPVIKDNVKDVMFYC